MTHSMDYEAKLAEADAKIRACERSEDLEQVEREYLGRRGIVAELLASIGKMTVSHLGLDVGPAGDGEPSYYEGVRDRNFGYDPSDDTVWRVNWRP